MNKTTDYPREVAPMSVLTDDVDLMERRLQLAQQIASKLAASSLVPKEYRDRPDDCFVAIQMGAELGMGPFQAIQSISVINGRPALWGDGLMGVVRASKKCLYIRETFDPESQTATCETKRVGDEQPISRSFSREDGIRAGLIGKMDTWKKYEARMLQMRARSWCLRDAYADVLRGLSSAEEMMDVEDQRAREIMQGENEHDETVVVSEPAVTLEAVIEGIAASETMEQLLLAGEQAKRLWAKDDQEKARIAYRHRRDTLKAQEEPSNAES